MLTAMIQLAVVLGTVVTAFSPEANGLNAREHIRSLSSTYMNEHGEMFASDVIVSDDERSAVIHVQQKDRSIKTITVKDHEGDELRTLQNNVCFFKCYWTDETSEMSCFEMFRPKKADVPKPLKDACINNEIIGLTLTSCNPTEGEVTEGKVTMKTCKKCYNVTYKERTFKRECCKYKRVGYRKRCERQCQKALWVTKTKEVCKETLSAFC